MTTLRLLAMMAAAVVCGFGQAGPVAEVAWTFEAGEGIVGEPVVLGAGRGVVVALGSGKLVMVGARGELVRTFAMDEAASGPVAAGRLGIVAVDAWGSVYCFGEDGRRRWKYGRESNMGSYRLPVVADVDGDGREEVLVADSRGRMLLLDAWGKLKLEFRVTSYRLSPPAVADLDGDGVAEIVFGTEDGEIYCFDGWGELRWVTHAEGRFGRTLPVIADLDGDGRAEVFVSTAFGQARPGVYAFDAGSGRRLWKAETVMQSYQSMVAADVDGDGKTEMVFGDKNTSLYAVRAGGAKVWTRQLGGRGIFFAPVVVDLQGDGKGVVFTVVRGTGPEGSSLYAVDGAGRQLQGVELPGGGTASPAVARFVGESELKLLAVGGAGKLVCFRLRQAAGKAQVVTAGRGRAAIPAMAPLPAAEERLGWHGSNSLGLKGKVAEGAAVVRVARPDGRVVTEVHRFGAGLKKPVLKYEAEMSGTYDVAVRWTGGPVAEHYRVTVPANGWKDEDRQWRYEPKIEALRAILPERGAFFDGILAATRGAVAMAGLRRETRWWDRAADVRHELLSLAEYVARVKPEGEVLVTQMPNPWAELNAEAYYKAVQSAPGAVRVRMLGNEKETVALVVTNLRPEAVTVRLELGGFARKAVTLHEAPLVLPESTGRETEDVLPRLADGGLLRLGALESRKVWMVIGSSELAAGRHEAVMRVGGLASTAKPVEVRLGADVLAARLPEKKTYRHNSWLYLAGIADAALRKKTMEDALEHGMNVFHIPAATVKVDGAGKMTGSDAAMHDELVRALRGKAFFLVGGSVNVAWPKGVAAASELKDKVFAQALQWYGRHMKELGVGYEDYALYVQDEPGLMGDDENYRQWMATVRRIKAADPKMKIYANPAGGARASILKEIAGLIDVWQPDLHLFRDEPEELGTMFGKATFWHYEAPGDQRNLDALGYYRMKPWVAFGLGMTGGGYWVYSSSDYWFFHRQLATEYGTVYPTPEGPVTTKRWEASREGVEDFELLTMVKARGGAAAQALVKEAVAFVTAGQEEVSDISRQLRPYTPSYERWMEYRARLMEAAAGLEGR